MRNPGEIFCNSNKSLLDLRRYVYFLEAWSAYLAKLQASNSLADFNSQQSLTALELQTLFHRDINQFLQFVVSDERINALTLEVADLDAEKKAELKKDLLKKQDELLRTITLQQQALQKYGWVKASFVALLRFFLETQHFTFAKLWLEALQDLPVARLDESYLKWSKHAGGTVYLLADIAFSYWMRSPSKSLLALVPNYILNNNRHSVVKAHQRCGIGMKTTLNWLLPIYSFILGFIIQQLLFARSKHPVVWLLGFFSYFCGVYLSALLIKNSLSLAQSSYGYFNRQLGRVSQQSQLSLNNAVDLLTGYKNINHFLATVLDYVGYFVCAKAGTNIGIRAYNTFFTSPEQKITDRQELTGYLTLPPTASCKEIKQTTHKIAPKCQGDHFPRDKQSLTGKEAEDYRVSIGCPSPPFGDIAYLRDKVCPR